MRKPLTATDYANSFQAREALIWCALTAVSSSAVKDPVEYINRRARQFGAEMLKQAVGLSYNWIRTECHAVCVDKIDAALSAKHGWPTIQVLRSR